MEGSIVNSIERHSWDSLQLSVNKLVKEKPDTEFSLLGCKYAFFVQHGALVFYRTDLKKVEYVFEMTMNALFQELDDGSWKALRAPIEKPDEKEECYYDSSFSSSTSIVEDRFYCILPRFQTGGFKNIYVFSPKAPNYNRVHCMIRCIKKPYFVQDRLIEINTSGILKHRAAVFIYDLKKMKQNGTQDLTYSRVCYFKEIDDDWMFEVKKTHIIAKDSFSDKKYEIPIFDDFYQGVKGVITVGRS